MVISFEVKKFSYMRSMSANIIKKLSVHQDGAKMNIKNWQSAMVPSFHAFPSSFAHHCGSEIIMWISKRFTDLKEWQFPGESWRIRGQEVLAIVVTALGTSYGWCWYDWAVCSWKQFNIGEWLSGYHTSWGGRCDSCILHLPFLLCSP